MSMFHRGTITISEFGDFGRCSMLAPTAAAVAVAAAVAAAAAAAAVASDRGVSRSNRRLSWTCPA